MTALVLLGEEYTPRVAAAFAELLAAIAENLRNADGTGVVVRAGDDADLSVLLNLDTDLPILVAANRSAAVPATSRPFAIAFVRYLAALLTEQNPF